MKGLLMFTLFFCCNLNCSAQNSSIIEEKSSLFGKWISSEYLDSTVVNRSIYEYSGGFASAAYALEIDTSYNCYMKGFHEECEVPMIEWNEQSAQYSFDAEQIWTVKLVKNDLMKMSMTYNDNTTAPTFYKRLKEDFPNDIEEYFMREIFIGSYRNLQNNELVRLTQEGTVENLDSISKYEIVVDFWDNPAGDFDMIYLKKENSYNVDYLHAWKFNGDTLLIKSLQITIDYDSGFYQGEPADIKYRLLKKD